MSLKAFGEFMPIPFVIIYTIAGNKIIFLHFDHHDNVYDASAIFTPAQMAELRERFEGFEDY